MEGVCAGNCSAGKVIFAVVIGDVGFVVIKTEYFSVLFVACGCGSGSGAGLL